MNDIDFCIQVAGFVYIAFIAGLLVGYIRRDKELTKQTDELYLECARERDAAEKRERALKQQISDLFGT